MTLMPMFGDVSDVVESGTIAQRRRKGDRHVLNALRTWASAIRPPEPPRTHLLLLPQTLTLTAKHGTFVARQRNAGLVPPVPSSIKKNSFRTSVLRSFRNPSSEVLYMEEGGGPSRSKPGKGADIGASMQ